MSRFSYTFSAVYYRINDHTVFIIATLEFLKNCLIRFLSYLKSFGGDKVFHKIQR